MTPKSKAFLLFVAKACGIYILWMIISIFVIGEYNGIDQLLTESEAYIVCKLFSFFQYEGVFYVVDPPDASILYWGEKRLVGISDSCNGLVLFVTFIGFIIAFPSKLKPKLWYIPFGDRKSVV